MHFALAEIDRLRTAAHARALALAEDGMTTGSSHQIGVAAEAQRLIADAERMNTCHVVGTVRALWPKRTDTLATAIIMLPGASDCQIEALARRLAELRLIEIERSIARQTLRLWARVLKQLSGQGRPWCRPNWRPPSNDLARQ